MFIFIYNSSYNKKNSLIIFVPLRLKVYKCVQNFFIFFNILQNYGLLNHLCEIWNIAWESSSSWSYGSLIYNYLCQQCLSPLKLWVRIPLMARCIRYNIMW